MYPSLNARALGLSLTGSETIQLAAEFGFGGVDLLVRDIIQAGESLADLRKSIDDLGLQGGAFPLPMNWRGEESTFRNDLARLPELADTAAQLGISRTGTWVMPETPGMPSASDAKEDYLESVAQLHRDRLSAIASVLARSGIEFGLEVVGVKSFRKGEGIPFVTRLGDLTRQLGPIEKIGSNVGVLVDGFHLYAADEPVEAGLAWGVSRVVWVHLADLPRDASAPDRDAIIDSDRGLPGEHGAIDSQLLLNHLFSAGYKGPVTAEPMPGCRSLQDRSTRAKVQAVAESLRRVWPV